MSTSLQAELAVGFDEMQVERDRYLKENQKKDLFIRELEEEVQFVKVTFFNACCLLLFNSSILGTRHETIVHVHSAKLLRSC